jgi:hypothetical protein
MSTELRQVLHRAAGVPHEELDLEALLGRSRRRRRRHQAAAVAASFLLVVGVAVAVGQAVPRTHDQPRPDTPAAPVDFTGLPTGWSELPAPPQVRHDAATGWTGQQLLLWGGTVPGYSSQPDNTGFRFDTRTGRWQEMAASPLAARIHPASAWTGRELLVWGGAAAAEQTGPWLADGAAYDPENDTWRPLPPAPVSPRAPLSVWTGDELLVWGTALRRPDVPTNGAAYHPASDSWRPITSAPVELTDATAVWTGHEMIVLGASLSSSNTPATPQAIGAAYHPGTGTWRRLPDPDLSPQASTAVWNGRELVAIDTQGTAASYQPSTDQWLRLPDAPLDPGECDPHSAPVGDQILAHLCRGIALYDPAETRWQDISHHPTAGWWAELVPAGPVTVVLAKDIPGGTEAVLAYRPEQ